MEVGQVQPGYYLYSECKKLCEAHGTCNSCQSASNFSASSRLSVHCLREYIESAMWEDDYEADDIDYTFCWNSQS
ncbi:uncharacterized protein BT62DRAFT_927200 [Guyanagaster necrorhizus]|uniref:Uncharacterized protein n=1 Tax=Guyanagaster necrorhizus TaxID=856835 RepID=A0A9P7W3L7_9AGAR|nr:uncharacterized protein BT62DRAFT_927200 [Guyanagaster necrorhizus MCA 3950]KAG7451484.1 hypothetical protein BT62DRAFT_927200 [Guyanagaster necrorhizus MCA 3950]